MDRLRGALFLVAVYALMGVMGLLGLPLLLVGRNLARSWMKLYIRLLRALARAMLGLEVEVRGPVPRGRVLVVAKHQSLIDVLILFETLPEARFVMKRELLWTPFFGIFARRAGALPIDRSRGAEAVARMLEAFREATGQIVIYPQGTRVNPGAWLPYKRGATTLYEALGLPAVLVATNAGHFWPRKAVPRGPGTVVVEFFETVAPGMEPEAFRALIEKRIEAASDALSRETGSG